MILNTVTTYYFQNNREKKNSDNFGRQCYIYTLDFKQNTWIYLRFISKEKNSKEKKTLKQLYEHFADVFQTYFFYVEVLSNDWLHMVNHNKTLKFSYLF